MSHENFVNRDQELAYLLDRYSSGSPELIILYGRRRIGKTELLTRFLAGKDGVYILCSTEAIKQNIRLFAHEFSLFLQDPGFEDIQYPSFESLFTNFTAHHRFRELSLNGKIAIVIDEFPYLIERDSSIPSIFQRIWDLYLSKLPVMLILSGSSISIMEQEVLGSRSPLFGRRTGQWQVEQLSFTHLKEFVPYSPVDLAQVWFVCGGVPAYLRLFNLQCDFWTNVSNLFLTKGAYLYLEAELLLQYEFREPANYLTILKSVANGMTTLAEIVQSSGLDRSMVSKYLSVLQRLHIIREEISVTAPVTSRKRQYRLSDPYLSFWFRFVYPDMTAIESGHREQVLARIKDTFSLYCGYQFEELIGHLIREGIILNDIPVNTLGRWWYKEHEIDLVGLHEPTKTLLCVECKWSDISSREAKKILGDLALKSQHIRWNPDERREILCLVARTIIGKEKLRDAGHLVFDLTDLCYLEENSLPVN